MTKRISWQEVRGQRMKNPKARAAYEQAAVSFALAEQVRQIREDKGLSQAELAVEMGTTQSAVARLEAGGTSPTIPTLKKLADALGVELVLGFNDPRSGAKGKRAQEPRAGAGRMQKVAAKSTSATKSAAAGKKGAAARSTSRKKAAKKA